MSETIDLSSIQVEDEFEEDLPADDQIQEIPEESAPDAVESVEESKPEYGYERRKKILILQMYLNEFPEKLKDYKNHDFESMTSEELDKIREEMDFILGCRSTTNVGVNMFLQSVAVFESLATQFTPLNVSGLAEMSAQDKELIQDVKHVCLKNMDFIQTEPEARVAFKLLQNAFVLNTLNKQQEKIKAAEAAEAAATGISAESEISTDNKTAELMKTAKTTAASGDNIADSNEDLNNLNDEFGDLIE